jgi:hypothetical protein
MMPMNLMPPRGSILSKQIGDRVYRDLLVAAGLIGLCVAARALPHAPNFTPVAACALFAASILRLRALSLVVPVFAMLLGDWLHGFYDWRMMAIVYAALALPACAASLSGRLRGPRAIVPVMLASAAAFFLITNFAVWAFGSMYAPDAGGLVACYVAALPFLKYTIAGDLFWAAALFGGQWLLQNIHAADAAMLKPAAVTVRRGFDC